MRTDTLTLVWRIGTALVQKNLCWVCWWQTGLGEALGRSHLTDQKEHIRVTEAQGRTVVFQMIPRLTSFKEMVTSPDQRGVCYGESGAWRRAVVTLGCPRLRAGLGHCCEGVMSQRVRSKVSLLLGLWCDWLFCSRCVCVRKMSQDRVEQKKKTVHRLSKWLCPLLTGSTPHNQSYPGLTPAFDLFT